MDRAEKILYGLICIAGFCFVLNRAYNSPEGILVIFAYAKLAVPYYSGKIAY